MSRGKTRGTRSWGLVVERSDRPGGMLIAEDLSKRKWAVSDVSGVDSGWRLLEIPWVNEEKTFFPNGK